MYMTDHQKLAEARVMAIQMDKLARSGRRISPSAPIIIPILLIIVSLFALICLLIKLFMIMKGKKNDQTKPFRPSSASSPDIPTTPEHDQSSMATTASMKTRGSLRLNPDRRKQKLPPVSLYQMKAKQSPGSTSKTNKAAMKALARSARAEANRSLSRDSTRQMEDNSDDNINDNGDVSPGNLSHQSDDTDDLQNTLSQSGRIYSAAANVGPQPDDQVDGSEIQIERNLQHSVEQPELHIVQMREVEDVHHSQPTWPQNESQI